MAQSRSHFLFFLACFSCLLLLLLSLSIDVAAQGMDGSKQQNLLRCKACIDAAARIHEKMESTPLGEVVRTMHTRKGTGRKPAATNEDKTRLVRAYEIVESACDNPTARGVDSEINLGTLCRAVLEDFEDDFVDFVKKDGKGAKVDVIQDVCLPVCEMRRQMKEKMDRVKDKFQKRERAELLQEILEVYQTNWILFVGLFCILVPFFIYIQFKIYGSKLAQAALKEQRQKMKQE